MTTVEIEGVVMTPEVHSVLAGLQQTPTYYTEIFDRTIDYLLSEGDCVEIDTEKSLLIIKGIYFLKKQIESLVPKTNDLQEGGQS